MANSFLMGVNLAGAEFAPQHVPGVSERTISTPRIPRLITMRQKVWT